MHGLTLESKVDTQHTYPIILLIVALPLLNQITNNEKYNDR